jgi:tetratricopeptide (TPR) repeat protein
LLEKAIALDPGYARAYAYMANSYRLEWSRDMSGSDQLLDRALELAQKGVALDENNDACHQDLGWILMHRRAHELAEHHFQKTLNLNPNRPSTLTSLGCLYAYLGKPDEALGYFKMAHSLDPLFEPSWYWRMLGVVLFVARRLDEAIAAFKKSPSLPFWVHGYLAACYAITDRIEDARHHTAEVLRLAPDASIMNIQRNVQHGFRDQRTGPGRRTQTPSPTRCYSWRPHRAGWQISRRNSLPSQ